MAEPIHPETRWTPWGEGYTAWNGKSPELEYVRLCRAWAELQRPDLIVETGTGSGRVTQHLARHVDSKIRAFETDPEWRARAEHRLAPWIRAGQVEISTDPSPGPTDLEEAGLVLLDSITSVRFLEISTWAEVARPGAFALVHDVSQRHQIEEVGTGIHGRLFDHVAEVVEAHGLTVILLPNPRGGALLAR